LSEVSDDEDSARLRLRQALHRAPLFADLDTASMMAVEHELTPLVLPGGTPLFHQGDVADAVYVVASGCLGVFRHDDVESPDGPALIAEITPGNIVGEMSLLTRKPATATVTAQGNAIVLRLPRESFQELVLTHPQILELVSELTEKRKSATEAILQGENGGMSFV